MKEWHEQNKGEKMSKQDLSLFVQKPGKVSDEERNLLQIRVDKLNEENGSKENAYCF